MLVGEKCTILHLVSQLLLILIRASRARTKGTTGSGLSPRLRLADSSTSFTWIIIKIFVSARIQTARNVKLKSFIDC